MSAHWPKAFDNAPCKKVLCGIKKTASAKKADISIIPLPKKTGYHSEYYRLQVTPKQIQIFAHTDTGVYRALNTLMQMVPADHYLTKAEKFSIPAVSIEDQPAYNYRGLHLDVCRHFFSVDFIKRYIDAMTLFKFNVFHWHLTEDQGWRIEIKTPQTYPDWCLAQWKSERSLCRTAIRFAAIRRFLHPG
jgi:hexosaminidase